MVIQSKIWKAIAVKSSVESDYELGYEAPATQDMLKWLQKKGISIVQIVGQKVQGMPELIRPDSPNRDHFSPDQKFRIMEGNTSFKVFEKALWGEDIPENRFDDLISSADPNAWGKTDRGYSLRLSPLLSYEKTTALKESLIGYSDQIKNVKDARFELMNRVLASDGYAMNLDSVWKEAQKQNLHPSPIILDFEDTKQAVSPSAVKILKHPGR